MKKMWLFWKCITWYCGWDQEIEKILPGKFKSSLEKVVNGLPSEVLGEEGPTGPKLKANWTGDES